MESFPGSFEDAGGVVGESEQCVGRAKIGLGVWRIAETKNRYCGNSLLPRNVRIFSQ